MEAQHAHASEALQQQAERLRQELQTSAESLDRERKEATAAREQLQTVQHQLAEAKASQGSQAVAQDQV